MKNLLHVGRVLFLFSQASTIKENVQQEKFSKRKVPCALGHKSFLASKFKVRLYPNSHQSQQTQSVPTTQSHETGETLNTIDFHFYLYSPINQRGNFQINDNVNFPFKMVVCITASTCYKGVNNQGGDPLMSARMQIFH